MERCSPDNDCVILNIYSDDRAQQDGRGIDFLTRLAFMAL